jgi:sulfur relay (sulfurtransferase) complex TusBCD TusD component (DsrE family)
LGRRLAGGAGDGSTGGRRIVGRRAGQHDTQHREVNLNGKKSIVVIFKSDGMGVTANQELRETLARKFLTLIVDAEPLPAAICFYTDGVRLACTGSPLLPELRALEERGVHLVLCKTCIDASGLADQVQVGVVGGMPDIITAMWAGDTVIEL